MPEKPEELREKLAELAHKQWSGWMIYLFSKGEFNNDGTWTMPVWAVDRWTRQMRVLYANLSREEKDTDCKEADKFLKIFEQRFAGSPMASHLQSFLDWWDDWHNSKDPSSIEDPDVYGLHETLKDMLEIFERRKRL